MRCHMLKYVVGDHGPKGPLHVMSHARDLDKARVRQVPRGITAMCRLQQRIIEAVEASIQEQRILPLS